MIRRLKKTVTAVPAIIKLLRGKTPEEVTIADKNLPEQIRLINQLDQEEQQMIFKLIDSFLTKKKFKEFFQKISRLSNAKSPGIRGFAVSNGCS